MKLIDADALSIEFIHRMDYYDDILEIIEEMPEAVMRCGDCRYNYGNATGREYNPYDIVCSYFDTDGMEASDYCSRGIYKKRRTDEAGRTD